MATTDVFGASALAIGGQATVEFVHGVGQVDSDIVVEVDWDNDGDFDQAVEDVTGDVVDAQSLTGRDFPSQLTGKAGPGRFQATLRNDDDRYSFFNTASPLNTGPFSLGSGRRVRVRTSDATGIDPVLLASDRFDGSGVLTVDDLGNPWITEGVPFARGDGYATVTSIDGAAIATIDVGQNDFYTQVTSRWKDGGSVVAIVYRFDDDDNHGWVRLTGTTLRHTTIVAGGIGVDNVVHTFDDEQNHEAMTFGVLVAGTEATVYLEGVPLATFTAYAGTSDETGVRITWNSDVTDRAPAVDRIDVWDGVPAEVEGTLWTGYLATVTPDAQLGPDKTVRLTAEGVIASAATREVTPSPQVPGYPTGIALGHVLAQGGLLHPPGPIDEGDIVTGAYGFDPGSTLDRARTFEETELGFFYEAQEGWLAFDSRSARDARPVTAMFSDAPGAQFGYSSIALGDWRREVINEVVAGIAPSAPVVESVTTRSGNTASGVANDVAVQMPATLNAGELLLVVIASTVRTSQRQWENVTNAGWAQLRAEGDAYRIRAYAKAARSGDASRTYTFYDDVSSGGAWVAKVFRISNWWGQVASGVAQGDMAVSVASLSDPASQGSSPPALPVPWGLGPSLFVTARAGLTSASGGTDAGAPAPIGYNGNLSTTMVNGSVNGFDVSLGVGYRPAITTLEAPGAWSSDTAFFAGWEFVNSCVFAVRGFNGSPPVEGGPVTVVVDDKPSIAAHGGIPRNHAAPSTLFADEDDATDYCQAILSRHAVDRPIVTIQFPATATAAARLQAIRRRVGHKIRLVANGDTGMGINADFYVEAIAHRWTNGAKLWTVTWQLSPAA